MKINKFLISGTVIILSFITGCSSEVSPPNEPIEMKANYPKELKDCKTFMVFTEKGKGSLSQSLIITRCPNSSTETSYGKNMRTTTQELPNNQKQ